MKAAHFYRATVAITLLGGNVVSAAPSGPPPPPKDARKLRTAKPTPPGKIIRLEPGQTHITPEQLKGAASRTRKAKTSPKATTAKTVKPKPGTLRRPR
jgi:hypothetical protein